MYFRKQHVSSVRCVHHLSCLPEGHRLAAKQSIHFSVLFFGSGYYIVLKCLRYPLVVAKHNERNVMTHCQSVEIRHNYVIHLAT